MDVKYDRESRRMVTCTEPPHTVLTFSEDLAQDVVDNMAVDIKLMAEAYELLRQLMSSNCIIHITNTLEGIGRFYTFKFLTGHFDAQRIRGNNV